MLKKLFNRWRPYPKYKPDSDGWYICSIKYGDRDSQEYVMDLWYDVVNDKWKDNRRQDVYNCYTVTNYEGNKMYSDNLCIRKDVIAFKNIPKTYKTKRKKWWQV